jgi:hypothetical protein
MFRAKTGNIFNHCFSHILALKMHRVLPPNTKYGCGQDIRKTW